MMALGKSPRIVGGLMRSPRFRTMAIDRMMKLDESVAMMGGIRRRRISAKLKTPTRTPTSERQREPDRDHRRVAVHRLDRDRAGEDHRGRDGEVDVARPSVMTSIWPMATSVKKLPKMKAAVSSPTRGLAAR